MLTVIVPTLERPLHLGRLLDYFVAGRLRARVLVADSSTIAADANRAHVDRAARELDIAYVHMPAGIKFYRKCVQAIEACTSPYVVLCADDDFLVPASAVAAAEYLDAHPECSIAHGRAALATLGDSGILSPGRVVRTRTLRACRITDPDPRVRLHAQMDEFCHVIYSVHRRAQLLDNFRLMDELELDYELGELLEMGLSMIQGQAGFLDRLFWIKTDTAIATSRTSSEMMMSWGVSVTAPDFSARYGRYRDALVDALVRATGDPADVLVPVVNRAFVAFLKVGLTRRRKGEITRVRELAGELAEVTSRAARVARGGLQHAVQRGRLLAMLRAPREAYRALANELDDMAVGRLSAEASPFQRDFVPVLEALTRVPY